MDRRPHPWNTGFEWQNHTGECTTVTTEQAAQFDELGYFVLEDAFDNATLQQLDAALQPGDRRAKEFLSGAPDGRFGVAGLDSQTIAPHAVTRSAFAREITAHETLAGIARDLVGPDVRLYWDQSVYKAPNGSEPVLWHQDNGYTYVEPQAYLTCWIAINDATPANGCVNVVPRASRRHARAPLDSDRRGVLGRLVGPSKCPCAPAASSCSARSLRTRRSSTRPTRCARPTSCSTSPTAIALRGDASKGAPVQRDLLGDDERAFWVVRDGARVEPPRWRAPSDAVRSARSRSGAGRRSSRAS